MNLLKQGIRGIVNFSPVLLKVPGDVVVNNVNLSDEIESVIWSVHKHAKEESLFIMAAVKTGYEISVRGLVQGVGFRPFICRLAFSHDLSVR